MQGSSCIMSTQFATSQVPCVPHYIVIQVHCYAGINWTLKPKRFACCNTKNEVYLQQVVSIKYVFWLDLPNPAQHLDSRAPDHALINSTLYSITYVSIRSLCATSLLHVPSSAASRHGGSPPRKKTHKKKKRTQTQPRLVTMTPDADTHSTTQCRVWCSPAPNPYLGMVHQGELPK